MSDEEYEAMYREMGFSPLEIKAQMRMNGIDTGMPD